jgi:serine/threonine protein kinase
MQGDSKSNDDLRALLRALGASTRQSNMAAERWKNKVEASRIHPREVLGDYIVQGLTHGCKRRAQENIAVQKFKVWGATHLPSGEDRVLKAANPKLLTQRPELEEFTKNEHKVLSRLDHPNIITVYDPVVKGCMTYLPMEHLPFCAEDVIGDRPDMEGITFFAKEGTKALQYLKREGVVHGDIKPSQFRVGPHPNNRKYNIVKLLDFGGSTHPDLPHVGMIYTAVYVAPELLAVVGTDACSRVLSDPDDIARRFKLMTHKADMFAFGLTVARVALSSTSNHDDISTIFDEPGKCASRAVEAMYGNHLPYMLNRIIEAATHADPNERIDADQMMEQLKSFCKVFGLGPKIEKRRDLYSGEIRVARAVRKY